LRHLRQFALHIKWGTFFLFLFAAAAVALHQPSTAAEAAAVTKKTTTTQLTVQIMKDKQGYEHTPSQSSHSYSVLACFYFTTRSKASFSTF